MSQFAIVMELIWIGSFFIYLGTYKTVYKKLDLKIKYGFWEWCGVFALSPLMALAAILTLLLVKLDAEEKKLINQPMPGEVDYINHQMDTYGITAPKKNHKKYTPEEVMQKILQ